MPQTNSSDTALGEVLAFPLLHGFERKMVSDLCSGGEVRVQRHREVVFNHGETASHFGIVLTGAYKLSRLTYMGDETIIHFSSPGDVVAALVMPQPNPIYPVNVRAMGPSRMMIIPRETYLKYWLSNPLLIARIQQLLSSRMGRFQNQKIMQRAPLRAKMAALLLNLLESKDDGADVEVPLPLTRKEIADSLGVTVESVIRVMSDWSKQGMVSTSDHRIRILKPGLLVEQVNEPSE